jgi:hypothetical protein
MLSTRSLSLKVCVFFVVFTDNFKLMTEKLADNISACPQQSFCESLQKFGMIKDKRFQM